MVLFWYQSKFNNLSDFMKHISKNTVALNLMLQYYRQKSSSDQDTDELGSILNQENLKIEQVMSILKVAFKQTRNDQKVQMLDEARRLFGNDDKFNANLISDELKLMKVQAVLDKNFRLQLTNKSLFETIGELISRKILDEAEKLRKEFKISDTSEVWWHLKAKNLAIGHQWEELEKFSKSKKSVIGYEPFVNYCMLGSSLQEARKYLSKVPQENKFKCLIKMKCYAEALDLSFQTKDISGINIVISRCDASQRSVIEKAKTMRTELLANQK
jgi:vacuolar protein sorting-associated protein 16